MSNVECLMSNVCNASLGRETNWTLRYCWSAHARSSTCAECLILLCQVKKLSNVQYQYVFWNVQRRISNVMVLSNV